MNPGVLGKFSFGMGDRFARQAKAQLQAIQLATKHGATIEPIWNKSNREHLIAGSHPDSVRQAAAAAVRELGWSGPYHIDADHIRLDTVDRFLGSSDFFTIDVADSIGQAAPGQAVQESVKRHPELAGKIEIPGITRPFQSNPNELFATASKYLLAIQQAGKIYRHIAQAKGAGRFVTEVSMDETDRSQTPSELLFILAAIADEKIPVQTIAPKFSGRFNKGVDYVGDVAQFEQEFRDDLAVIAHAVKRYELPRDLKLSVHSGSDKFSIYAPIRRAVTESGAGLHLKTAGTTWLEELIGLAESGGEGLKTAKEIYAQALAHREEYCAPYAAVIDVDPAKLPTSATVSKWSSEPFAAALRHDPKCSEFNPHLRQLLHVSYKVAAGYGERYLQLLDACQASVARNVTHNLFERHLKPLFLD